ncbi:hypothetical protein Taro_019975, partial [Colocasia esculenta]|nr:hypothetical protein [Colocasia esculenta]
GWSTLDSLLKSRTILDLVLAASALQALSRHLPTFRTTICPPAMRTLLLATKGTLRRYLTASRCHGTLRASSGDPLQLEARVDQGEGFPDPGLLWRSTKNPEEWCFGDFLGLPKESFNDTFDPFGGFPWLREVGVVEHRHVRTSRDMRSGWSSRPQHRTVLYFPHRRLWIMECSCKVWCRPCRRRPTPRLHSWLSWRLRLKFQLKTMVDLPSWKDSRGYCHPLLRGRAIRY